MDEIQDLSWHEQISVFIRYVNNLEPKEVFWGFYYTKWTNEESLVELLKEVLKLKGLKIKDIRGQYYDGVASINHYGMYKGIQARIWVENNSAIYLHCSCFKCMSIRFSKTNVLCSKYVWYITYII